MRVALVVLALVLLMTGACAPFGPAPTPTLTPQRLPDQAMQDAALKAVQDYAGLLDYEYNTPSFSVIDDAGAQVALHVTVGFRTRKGFPFEEYDSLFFVRKTAIGWQADTIKRFSKLEWEWAMQRGPLALKSPAGFTVNVPAGWVGYVAPQSELRAPNVCGVGAEPISAVVALAIAPAGYSAENMPIVLRGFQQCPRAASLSAILQRIQRIRDSDKTIRFDRLEMTQFGGQPALIAVMADANGTVLYDIYVMYRERQLEFTLQARGGLDLTDILGALNGIQFN